MKKAFIYIIFLIFNLSSCSILMFSPYGMENEKCDEQGSYVIKSFDNTYISFALEPVVYSDEFSFNENFYEINTSLLPRGEKTDFASFIRQYINPSIEFLKSNYPPLLEASTVYNSRRLYRGGCEYFFPTESKYNSYIIDIWPPHDKSRISRSINNIYLPPDHTIRISLTEDQEDLKYEIVPTKTNFGECELDEDYKNYRFFKENSPRASD